MRSRGRKATHGTPRCSKNWERQGREAYTCSGVNLTSPKKPPSNHACVESGNVARVSWKRAATCKPTAVELLIENCKKCTFSEARQSTDIHFTPDPFGTPPRFKCCQKKIQ